MNKPREPRTRIVCTLGPATDSDQVVRDMIRNGMDVARLNFSHGDHATHAARMEQVARIAHEERAVIAMLADLQGPKLRVGRIAADSVRLQPGGKFTLTTRPVPGDAAEVSVDFPALPAAVHRGDRILLNDGLIELRVLSVDESDVVTEVVNGGGLASHKGINLPGVSLGFSAVTDKDRADLQFAVERGVDYIALSFVRRAEDVMELKRLMSTRGVTIPVIAKIEKPEAIEHIDSILDVSDGVMVARGDLGVEVPPEKVPIYQKMIIRKSNVAGKPVITATQMLESMITNPRPTRAEASDVANAILDGTDAVMLSGETAVGKYPVESVEMMARIARESEGDVQFRESCARFDDGQVSVTDAIGMTTCEIARELNARVILTATSSGFTARMISRHRPQTPIFAVTWNQETERRLALVWGVQSATIPEAPDIEAMIASGIEAALEKGVVQKGDGVVITAGAPVGIAGRTNMIQVRTVGELA